MNVTTLLFNYHNIEQILNKYLPSKILIKRNNKKILFKNKNIIKNIDDYLKIHVRNFKKHIYLYIIKHNDDKYHWDEHQLQLENNIQYKI